MRQASYVAVVVALMLPACGGNTSKAPAVLSNNTSASNSDASASSSERLLKISRFDCVPGSDEEYRASKNEVPWNEGISRWKGGGPGGAAWNVDRMTCVVEVETPCLDGKVSVSLVVGGHLIAEQELRLQQSGTLRASFALDALKWEEHFDEQSKLAKQLPYRTATFSASALGSCEKPYQIGPSAGPRLEFADDSHFTAGFSTGE